MKTMLKSIFISAAVLSTAAVLPNISKAQRFHTARDLLASHFRSSKQVTFVQVHPTETDRQAIERRLRRRLSGDQYTFYVARSGETVDGYALFDEERGQHEMISVGTFFDAQGRVTGVEVLAYREPYGDGIRGERFRRQFVGRTAASGFRAGHDIDSVSGSTISSRSMAVAVQRATLLLKRMVLERRPAALAQR